MKKILLNVVQSTSPNYKKYSALVDDEDFERVSKHKWSVMKSNNTIYAHININGKCIYLHIFILGFKGIDHIDGNGLNNQKSNLRKATQQQNQMNSLSSKNSSSKFKGIYWSKCYKRWIVEITYNYRKIHLGSFTSETEAAERYNIEAVKLFGDFAKLNII